MAAYFLYFIEIISSALIRGMHTKYTKASWTISQRINTSDTDFEVVTSPLAILFSIAKWTGRIFFKHLYSSVYYSRFVVLDLVKIKSGTQVKRFTPSLLLTQLLGCQYLSQSHYPHDLKELPVKYYFQGGFNLSLKTQTKYVVKYMFHTPVPTIFKAHMPDNLYTMFLLSPKSKHNSKGSWN